MEPVYAVGRRPARDEEAIQPNRSINIVATVRSGSLRFKTSARSSLESLPLLHVPPSQSPRLRVKSLLKTRHGRIMTKPLRVSRVGRAGSLALTPFSWSLVEMGNLNTTLDADVTPFSRMD